MKIITAGLLFAAFIVGSVYSQTVNICGRVTDPGGKPLTHTLVRLGQTRFDNGYGMSPYYAVTDSDGKYKLGTGNCTVPVYKEDKRIRADAFSKPAYIAGQVLFSIPRDNLQVTIDLYDLTGNHVKELLNSRLSRGNYAVRIDTRHISSQLYCIRVSINGAASVFRLQPFSQGLTKTGTRNVPEFRSSLEKLAAVVDTLRATEPGYTLGVTPLSALAGQFDFTLTKNNTWNGDTTAFWDTTKIKKQAGKIWYTILNRTGGQVPDSMIYWAIGDFGAPVRLSDSAHIDFTNSASGRLYIMLGYKPVTGNLRPQNQVWDFEEHTNGPDNKGVLWFHGNTTRVDAYGTPMAYRIHCTDGFDTVRGEKYHVYFQTRQSFFDEFTNEVPYEFTQVGLMRAPYRIPNPGTSGSPLATGGTYASYWTKYCQAFGVTATAYLNGIKSPDTSAACHRHTMGMTDAQRADDKNFYKAAPCNFYSFFLHRRAIDGRCYGFPYDDSQNWSSYLEHGNVSWMAIAVGY
jgi:hypothetical protein